MSLWKKIKALLAIAAPLGIFVSACAMDATAPEEPRGLAVAAEATTDDSLGTSLSPLAAAASVSLLDETVACYHYFGAHYYDSNCHSFWFDSNFNFLRKNCTDGPCNPFPSYMSYFWTFWPHGGDQVICYGAWSPNDQQKKQLSDAYDAAPDC